VIRGSHTMPRMDPPEPRKNPTAALLIGLETAALLGFSAAVALTGLALTFYYRPSGDYAFPDARYLEFDVPFGMLLRNLHRWIGFLWVLAALANGGAAVLAWAGGAGRRGLFWAGGIALLFLAGSWTGHRVPWDQLGAWAVTVGTDMARRTPMLHHDGPFAVAVLGSAGTVSPRYDAREMLLGGTLAGSRGLRYFFWTHCVALPLATTALLVLNVRYLWRAARRLR